MKLRKLIFQHSIGIIIFGIIVNSAMFIANIQKFPSIASKLPMRMIVEAKQEINLYECSAFQNRVLVKTLKVGETAELEGVACGFHTRWFVKLSDGRKACYSARDEDKVEQKLLKFYYF
jgi:hypothetical protein